MPPLPFPLVNGNYFSWASIELVANGLPIPGVRSINYKDSLKPGKVRGTSAVHMGRTRGQYEASGDMELYRPDFETFKASLGGLGFMQRDFGINVSYSEPVLGTVMDTLLGVRITDVEVSNSDSSDGSLVKLTLDILVPIAWGGTPGAIAAP